MIDLHACKFMHAKISLRARCVHARHCACNLLNLETPQVAASDSVRIHPYSNYKSITDFFLAQSCKPPLLTWSYLLTLDTVTFALWTLCWTL